LTAQSKGLTYNYGIQTKIKVLKNQLPNPFTVTYEGEVICTPHGMIGVEKPDVEAYRKQYVGDILKSLQNMNTQNEVISEADITFSEEEEADI
jgi:hypothetical protein